MQVFTSREFSESSSHEYWQMMTSALSQTLDCNVLRHLPNPKPDIPGYWVYKGHSRLWLVKVLWCFKSKIDPP